MMKWEANKYMFSQSIIRHRYNSDGALRVKKVSWFRGGRSYGTWTSDDDWDGLSASKGTRYSRKAQLIRLNLIAGDFFICSGEMTKKAVGLKLHSKGRRSRRLQDKHFEGVYKLKYSQRYNFKCSEGRVGNLDGWWANNVSKVRICCEYLPILTACFNLQNITHILFANVTGSLPRESFYRRFLTRNANFDNSPYKRILSLSLSLTAFLPQRCWRAGWKYTLDVPSASSPVGT